ncbi:hypothetical protein RN49_05995 [Pantoea agglomerans]|nr:hypothetical protein RN49_05995 [Pantoea agglomerans]MBA5702799.1 hypothetical protein [Pantoea agglomerans]
MRAGGDQFEQRQHQTKSVISVYSDLGDLEAASLCGEIVRRNGDFMWFFSKAKLIKLLIFNNLIK